MADETVPADRDKSLYLTQIQPLGKEVKRDDICDYLIHSSNAAEMEVEELSEKLEHQQQVDKKETNALMLHLNQQKDELQKEMDRLKSKKMMHKEKLKQHQQERERMTERLAYMEFIEKQLYSKRKEHEAVIARLKKQMDLEEAKVFQDCGKQVQSSIKNKVSAIVEEERSQDAEVFLKVEELRAESFKLLKEKSILQCRKNKLCLEVKNKKSKSHVASQGVIKLKEKEERLSKKCQQLKVPLNNLPAKEQDLRQQLTLNSEVCSQKKEEAAKLEAELLEEMSRRRLQLKADMEKAVNILRPAVMGLEKLSEAQGKIQKLREILESNTSHGTESALYHSPEKSSGGQKLQTSGPRPVSAETRTLHADPLFLLAHYRPGDLGFVPRPRYVSGAGHQSTSSKLPPIRKLGCHKASIVASDDRANPSDLASQAWRLNSLLKPNPTRK